MLNRQHETQSFSMGEFVWFVGVVEDRMDPMKLGRVRVRCVGYHTDDKTLMPTDTLPWAVPMQDIRSAAISGIGMSPTGLVEGSWVVGFFRDGHHAQDPIIMGSIGGISQTKQPSKGFHDPNGQYPRHERESDTNRLSRTEKINETIVQSKTESRELNVVRSLNDGNWDEPAVPYAGDYPYNHVRETESGHIEEWDDTPGAERYQRYHRQGGFHEIHPDGKEVTKVVNDKYEVILGDEYIHVKGNVSITVNGNANVLVKGNSRLETGGNRDEYVRGNYRLLVGGRMQVRSGGQMFLDSPRIDLIRPGPGISF